MLVALAGGVGAARFLRGLIRVHPPADILVIGNTGDDLRVHGLAVSPDLDSVAYTLAGLSDEERGWGLAGETWNVLGALDRLGEPSWFSLGDRDIATHLLRTRLLTEGDRKSTRLNSSHVAISYAVFCLKKKKTQSARQPNEHTNKDKRTRREAANTQ